MFIKVSLQVQEYKQFIVFVPTLAEDLIVIGTDSEKGVDSKNLDDWKQKFIVDDFGNMKNI
jgi:hypothetical protein